MATKFTHGRFVWRELITDNAAKASGFYSELFGWKIKEADMGGGMKYYLVHLGEKQIGGFWPKDEKHSMIPNSWTGYVSVADVDAAAKAATAAGGKVMAGPQDIPNVGRFATIVDPQGAATNAFKSAHGDQEPGQPKAGEFCWESLSTTSTKAAVDFYTKVYGWQVKEFGPGMPFFAAGDAQVASYLEQAGVHPSWLSYVAVTKLGDARDRAKRLGAKILMEEVPVPGIGKFAVIQDPSGAVIAPFEPAPRQN